MLAKTILIVNHCRRIGKKGQWDVAHNYYTYEWSVIETNKLVLNNFWWFNQRPLKLVEEKECGSLDKSCLIAISIGKPHGS
jgi:hypothetical protein